MMIEKEMKMYNLGSDFGSLYEIIWFWDYFFGMMEPESAKGIIMRRLDKSFCNCNAAEFDSIVEDVYAEYAGSSDVTESDLEYFREFYLVPFRKKKFQKKN